MAIRQVTITGDGFTNTVVNNIPSLFYETYSDTTKMYIEGTDLFTDPSSSEYVTFFNNNILKIEASSKDYWGSVKAWYLGTVSDQYLGTVTSSARWFGAAFAVDDETEQGQIFECYYNGSIYGVQPMISSSNPSYLHRAYLAITESEYLISSYGGGATHIATRNGLLADLSSHLGDILIVAGGGGGALTTESTSWDGSETEIISSGGGD